MPSTQTINNYIPTEWFDNTAPAINAANLNHIELGIESATDEIIDLDSRVTDLEGIDSIPQGAIMLWSGDTVPTGWYLCDGNNGTPNLIGRFIRGDRPDNTGQTGGREDTIVRQHSHTFTGNSLASHNHGGQIVNTHVGAGNGQAQILSAGNQELIAKVITAESAGTPSGTISTEGENTTGSNRPPYYNLAYIMKA